LLADRRLNDVQPFGGTPEVQFLGQRPSGPDESRES
jgi:hypothetical protein